VTPPQIISDPNILCGKPCIGGTRISVELLLDKLGAGDSVPDILADYPFLTREQVLEAIRFAGRTLRLDSYFPAVTGPSMPGRVA
jgi:uncharacterized protein (DUF433 family)